MRFHEPLNEIMGNELQVKLLRLFHRTRSAHTGRELARLIGHSHNPTRAALEELERNGLVIHQRVGKANLYSLDNDNIIFTDILSPAFKLEDDLLNEAARIIYERLGRGLVSVVLFGSIARGEEDPDSDIDVVLVFGDDVDPKEKEEAIADASLEITRKFGNQLSPIAVRKSEYEKKVTSKKGLWKEIAETGQAIKP